VEAAEERLTKRACERFASPQAVETHGHVALELLHDGDTGASRMRNAVHRMVLVLAAVLVAKWVVMLTMGGARTHVSPGALARLAIPMLLHLLHREK